MLFVLSICLALAETAFVRMSRIRALALADEGNKRAARLAAMLERPEQTLNSVLLLVLVSQLTTATLLGVLLEGAAGASGVVIGIVLQIVLFFVIGEVAPKTFAVQHTERAALSVTPLLSFLTQFAPLRWTVAAARSGSPTSSSRARGSSRVPSSPRRRSAPWPTSPPTRRSIERRGAARSSTRSSSSATPSCAR